MKLHEKKRDCVASEFVSKLSSAVYPKIPEIKLKELKTIWEHWTEERQNAFTIKYGDIALLLSIEVDEQLLMAIIDAAKLQVHNIVSSNKVISKVSFSRGQDKTSTKIIVNLQLFRKSIKLEN